MKQKKWVKRMVVLLSIVLILIIGMEIYNRNSSSNIDTYSYQVEEQFDNVEIRNYEARYFNTVRLQAGDYKSNSGKGFRVLAGYIFGGNKENKTIAMTSPVVMDMGTQITMKFMVPKSENPELLPAPNSDQVKLELIPQRRVAAIQFGGWASDEKIEEYADKLFEVLKNRGIKHVDNYSYLGYNPPYQITGRRNEIIVDLN